jgi:hypothetical protein
VNIVQQLKLAIAGFASGIVCGSAGGIRLWIWPPKWLWWRRT